MRWRLEEAKEAVILVFLLRNQRGKEKKSSLSTSWGVCEQQTRGRGKGGNWRRAYKEEVVRNAEAAVDGDTSEGKANGGEEDGADVGDHDDEECDARNSPCFFSLAELSAVDENRLGSEQEDIDPAEEQRCGATEGREGGVIVIAMMRAWK
jgi:hypothetical protein